LLQKPIRPLFHQSLGDPTTQVVRVIGRADERGKDAVAAFGIEDSGIQAKAMGAGAAPRRHGDHTATFQLSQDTAFCEYPAVRSGVVEGSQQGSSRCVVDTALDAQRPLPNCR
jgi:hypothetical protein